MNWLQFFGAVEIGLLYGIVAIGVYITFRISDFPDLTVDGSFTLGGAVAASMISADVNPYIATLAATIAGSFAGMITGYLNVKGKILGLLAGILTMSALYSINLRIMGKPNLSVVGKHTIFNTSSIPLVLSVAIILLILLLTRLFSSNLGLAMRAIAVNPRVSSSYGINVGRMKIIALALSNSLVAFSGALFCQSQEFVDISIGIGTIIVGIASIIIGEIVLRPSNIFFGLIASVVGSIIYRLLIALALNGNDIGFEASDINLITALLITVTMIVTKVEKKDNR